MNVPTNSISKGITYGLLCFDGSTDHSQFTYLAARLAFQFIQQLLCNDQR